MEVVIDIEANGLENPTEVWVIVCKEILTGKVSVYRKVTQDAEQKKEFLEYAKGVSRWIGHNILGYDLPVLHTLIGLPLPSFGRDCRDTLILSRMINYSRPKHSLESYGLEFGFPKLVFTDFSKYSLEMEEYCVRDVEIAHKVYETQRKHAENPTQQEAIELEHNFQQIVNDLHKDGFAFNAKKAEELLAIVQKELDTLDKALEDAFPPRLKFLKEVHPRETKHGTLSKSDFRFVKDGDLSIYNGGPFSRLHLVEFNPASNKQLVEVLNEAGWKPENKTKTHVENLRELNRLKFQRNRTPELDTKIKELYTKLENQKVYGWKVDEHNLSTLPPDAPAPARSLAKRILMESRRRTLTEWLGLVTPEGRIHGEFYGIGAWTHRMSHQAPNMANIPREFQEDGSVKYLGKEMRELWQAPRNRLLVGVDAEGIQLRVFAHLVNDPELIDSLVKGRKDDKTDPHSLNQRILGSVCKTRQAAKRFIYALFLGGGLTRLSQILGCSEPETREALDRLLERFPGFQRLREEVIPEDAKRGYFIGLDGRKLPIPGETFGERKHLAMSGYLQSGEAIVVKKAALLTREQLSYEKDKWMFVDIVHDELQSEVPNNMTQAIRIAKLKAEAIAEAGRYFKLNCPMAGSYWNDDHNDYTIGKNWYITH